MFLSFHLPLFSLIPLFFLLPLLVLFKGLSSASKTYDNLPPSPPKLPIIGNFHQLGTSPHRYLSDLAKKHGPLLLIHLGSVPVLVASSAKAAREILKTHDLVFSNRPKLSIPHILTYGSKDIAFSPYGDYWRQIKSIAVVQLLSNRRIQSFRRVREEETRVMIEMIGKSCGSLVDLSKSIASLTNNIICKVALRRTYRVFKFNDLLRRLTYLFGVYNVGNYIPWLSWVDWLSGLEGEAIKVAKELDDFLESVIEEHIYKKQRVNVDAENDKDQDLVDILLDVKSDKTTGLTVHRDMIKGVIMDMFAAGTDTTSISIEWAISKLVRHPQVMKKLQQEVREIAQGRSMIREDDLEKMQYLKAVIKESLPSHPPAPLLLLRESTEYVKLMGYDIAAGTQVIINVGNRKRSFAMGRIREVYAGEVFKQFCRL